jgi:hypothetical protein
MPTPSQRFFAFVPGPAIEKVAFSQVFTETSLRALTSRLERHSFHALVLWVRDEFLCPDDRPHLDILQSLNSGIYDCLTVNCNIPY